MTMNTITIELLLIIIGLLLAMQTAMQAHRGPRLSLTGGGQIPAFDLFELERLRTQINNCFGGLK